MKAHGKHKVMFGTNYPMLTPEVCLKELSVLDLDDEIIELFLRENAMSVFEL